MTWMHEPSYDPDDPAEINLKDFALAYLVAILTIVLGTGMTYGTVWLIQQLI